jgi:hypothetical protein
MRNDLNNTWLVYDSHMDVSNNGASAESWRLDRAGSREAKYRGHAIVVQYSIDATIRAHRMQMPAKAAQGHRDHHIGCEV